MPADFHVDMYWSFRSPYSYLALRRLKLINAEYDVKWSVHVVYPLAVRKPEHFDHLDSLARPYFFRDSARVAEYLGVPFERPTPDPIAQDPQTLRIAETQPYIQRLTRLGAEATLRGRALPFVDEVSKLLWGSSINGWDSGGHLADATRRAGLELDDMEHAIELDSTRCDALIEANQAAQRRAGHWGVPLFVFEEEPFFGQDRMDVLLWRMRQRGLKPRHKSSTTLGIGITRKQDGGAA